MPGDWREQIARETRREQPEPQEAAHIEARLELQLSALRLQHRPGDIPQAEYTTERERLKGELAALQPAPPPAQIRDAADLLADFGPIWAAANNRERKRIVAALLDTVHLDCLEDGVLARVTPKPELALLFRLARQNLPYENGAFTMLVRRSPRRLRRQPTPARGSSLLGAPSSTSRCRC